MVILRVPFVLYLFRFLYVKIRKGVSKLFSFQSTIPWHPLSANQNFIFGSAPWLPFRQLNPLQGWQDLAGTQRGQGAYISCCLQPRRAGKLAGKQVPRGFPTDVPTSSSPTTLNLEASYTPCVCIFLPSQRCAGTACTSMTRVSFSTWNSYLYSAEGCLHW